MHSFDIIFATYYVAKKIQSNFFCIYIKNALLHGKKIWPNFPLYVHQKCVFTLDTWRTSKWNLTLQKTLLCPLGCQSWRVSIFEHVFELALSVSWIERNLKLSIDAPIDLLIWFFMLWFLRISADEHTIHNNTEVNNISPFLKWYIYFITQFGLLPWELVRDGTNTSCLTLALLPGLIVLG